MIVSIKNSDKNFEIDDEDYDLLMTHANNFRLTFKGDVHCYSKIHQTSTVVCRIIMGSIFYKNNWKEVDHIDRNKLNNKKSNLRFATLSQQAANKSKYKRSKNNIPFKGVYTDQSPGFKSGIRVNNKFIYLGRFKEPILAAIAYDKAAVKYFGEFASLNFQVQNILI